MRAGRIAITLLLGRDPDRPRPWWPRSAASTSQPAHELGRGLDGVFLPQHEEVAVAGNQQVGTARDQGRHNGNGVGIAWVLEIELRRFHYVAGGAPVA